MNTRQKKIIKIVGISLGIALLIGGGVYIAIQMKRKGESSDEPYLPTENHSTTTSSQSSRYTKKEIERMQIALFQIGITYGNNIIIDSIRNSGGFDGIMGQGFNTALNEAIRLKYLTSLNELYNKAN